MRSLLLLAALFLSPSVLYAAPARVRTGTFEELARDISSLIIGPLFVLILGAILIVFLFGLAKFIFSLGNTEDIEDGKRLMVLGIIALFVAFSFWGLVAMLSATFGF
jgi:phosphate starvation-inducible membrane PsiE